ncbi:hypothetical protein [Pseudoalteromonas lipolytica]|uniref:hypothetical protein n=1 Tax=Pseudoalteromonas lipolytica TaxID=570156 RepID=UPI00241CA247|nr:hypothetical protein [Pseudoalteromonas lipolytica]
MLNEKDILLVLVEPLKELKYKHIWLFNNESELTDFNGEDVLKFHTKHTADDIAKSHIKPKMT